MTNSPLHAAIEPLDGRHVHLRYERVGFRRVGVMRDYEGTRDDTWHDGLLMDLLAGEVRD